MQNIKLIVAYDGRNYRGWQKTPMGPSIEGALQSILEQILQHPTPLQAASRTDAGVHARGQVVNFLTMKHPLDLNRLKISLNSLLPKDVVVLSIEKMDYSFHPTLDCKGKEYRYYLCYGSTQFPQNRFYSWHYPHSLQIDEMRKSTHFFLGKHDFSAFCNVKHHETYTDFKREIHQLNILNIDEQRLCIQIRGNHFLYKMVRNIVGTLVYIGSGKILKESIPGILQSGYRPNAGVTAPAHGLFLHLIDY
jgi:tRNA pseudouridine38-40 synthase